MTVFLSAMLLLLLSILCSVFEFSRQTVLTYVFDCGTAATTESCLAAYHRLLWDKYGVFSMYDDGTTEALMEENLQAYGEFGQNWYPFRVAEADFFPIEALTDNHGEAFRRMAAAYMKAGLGDGETVRQEEQEDPFAQGMELAKRLEAQYGGFFVRPSEGEETQEDSEKRGFLSSVVDGLKDWKNRAVELLVFPGMEFSARQIEAIEEEKALASGERLSVVDRLLFKGYVCEKFPTLLKDVKGYDLEYILGRGDTDRENLLEVAGTLLLIREGFNLMYLSSSDFRQGELKAAAIVLAAFTGQPELIDALQGFLMVCWGFAEAVGDVKTLVNGGKVPLFKMDESWKTDLQSLLFGDRETAAGSSGNGLSYEDYLRFLLLLKNEETIALRALEVIQWRIREEEPGFSITQCVTEAEYELTIEAESFFQTMGYSKGSLILTRDGRLAYQ